VKTDERLQNKRSSIPTATAEDALLIAAHNYLKEHGFIVLVGIVDRIQEDFLGGCGGYELVIKFTGGKIATGIKP
jgi:hypothetical protein